MPNTYESAFSITGAPDRIAHLQQRIEGIQAREGVFQALVGAPPMPGNNAAFYGTPKDIAKQEFDCNLLENNSLIGNFQTVKSVPESFFLRLSQQYHVRVDVEYDCENDDACGKLIVEEGQLVERHEYTYLQGKYVLDISTDKENFWYELKIKTEDVYLDMYDSVAEIIGIELSFLDEEEQQQFTKLYYELAD